MTGWLKLRAYLLAYLPTLTNLTDADAVSGGQSLAQTDLPYFAEVGDPDADSFDVVDDTIDGLVEESGLVNVRFVARSGDTDLTALAASVEAWLTALRERLKNDQTLGGAFTQGSTVVLGAGRPGAAQTPNGAIVDVTVAVRYATRL